VRGVGEEVRGVAEEDWGRKVEIERCGRQEQGRKARKARIDEADVRVDCTSY
jgi:hypothetical protein